MIAQYMRFARGFESGQNASYLFRIPEAVDTYVAAIRRLQPWGPYVLAGYSYGSMLAFGMTKKMNKSEKNVVQFLGIFDLPPHIKTLMRQLGWNMALLQLVQFLGIIAEDSVDPADILSYRNASRSDAISRVLGLADNSRMEVLGLSSHGLSHEVQGGYYTMLGQDHVSSFSDKLRAALRDN